MRTLKNLNEENLLFFDIETARVVKELNPDSQLFDSWEYKVNKKGDMTQKEVIESYDQESGLYPEFSKIISIVVGKIVKGKIALITIDDSDEVDLLENFNDVLSRNSSDKLVGFVNTGFDTPFIFKRMIINGINPDERLDSSGLKPWEVDEIDLSKIWQGTSFNRGSLLNIATTFGLSSPKDDISGADVGKVYWKEGVKGLKRISRYCRKDVVTTINIFKKMRLEESLEVSTVEFEERPLILSLFDGGKCGKAELKELLEVMKPMLPEEREDAYLLLNSVVSGAKGKKTKLKKDHVKQLKQELDG
jgi:uncharacterized protein YprB with RNaseH-like and TPR domain